MNVFFVCGAPKSGTTWLQRLLDAHPQVSCSGEGHFIDRFAGPMAQVVSRYNELLGLEAEQVYQGQPYYEPIQQSEFDALARDFILRRLTSRPPGEGVVWIGDKTPGYAENLGDLIRIFPEARIVNIVRDPRDVAVSHLAHSQRAGVANALDPAAPEHRELIEKAVNGWLRAVRGADAFAERHPGRLHELRYRDLHADPYGEAARLFGFLGVDVSAPAIHEAVRVSDFEVLAGRKPGQEDLRSFLRKGVPDDWKQRLDPTTAAAIAEACAEPMRRKRFLPAARGSNAA